MSDTPEWGHKALIDHSLCERYIKELERDLARVTGENAALRIFAAGLWLEIEGDTQHFDVAVDAAIAARKEGI